MNKIYIKTFLKKYPHTAKQKGVIDYFAIPPEIFPKTAGENFKKFVRNFLIKEPSEIPPEIFKKKMCFCFLILCHGFMQELVLFTQERKY